MATIYSNSVPNFVKGMSEGNVVGSLASAFHKYYGFAPGKPEVRSWANSLQEVSQILDRPAFKDAYLAVEYELPYSQNRIDCVLFGMDGDQRPNIVVIELKQWQHIRLASTEITGNYVETYVGGGEKLAPHPSQQVKGYCGYLKSFVAELDKGDVVLSGLAYCHNYDPAKDNLLFDPKFSPLLEKYPIFTANDRERLAESLAAKLRNGSGWSLFNRFNESEIKPSQKLVDKAYELVSNRSDLSLIDDQIVAKNHIMWILEQCAKSSDRSVIIVQGGPGTGKSLIALNVLAEALKMGLNAKFTCKSKPFRQALTDNLTDKDSEYNPAYLIKYPDTLFAKNTELKTLYDLVIVDEAHRIETRFKSTLKESQVEVMIHSSKVSLFFIDDNQRVRRGEIGRSSYIKEIADRLHANVFCYELSSQFRCMGSQGYVKWLDGLLGIGEPYPFDMNDDFEFKVFDDVQQMYDTLVKKDNWKPNSARLTAGFCWPWTERLVDGQPVKDVTIGAFAMPWETHRNISRPPSGYVPWYEWAYRREGIKQVGCIYTAQGFEFDYVGVIIGPDMLYNKITGNMEFDISKTHDPVLKGDPTNFHAYVRNIYKVLMTRGIRGCYVYCVDTETADHIKSLLH